MPLSSKTQPAPLGETMGPKPKALLRTLWCNMSMVQASPRPGLEVGGLVSWVCGWLSLPP